MATPTEAAASITTISAVVSIPIPSSVLLVSCSIVHPTPQQQLPAASHSFPVQELQSDTATMMSSGGPDLTLSDTVVVQQQEDVGQDVGYQSDLQVKHVA